MTDELFTITDSKPDPLTAARNRLARAQDALLKTEQMHEERPERWSVIRAAFFEQCEARIAVAKLETAALKSL